MENLTTQAGVESLMRSSASKSEWNTNCDKVKKANSGYPSFWYAAIVMSGLMDKTLGAGASQLKISTF